MQKFKTMDGNEACATIAYMFTEVAGIYPITPSSVMAELVDEWSSKGLKNLFNDEVKVTQMQSEAGAAGMVHGSLQTGCLTSTFTSSQGLLLMIPNMYKIAGEMLPGVFNVAARSVATHALSILGDHQDIYATRMTGVAMLASSSVQQVMNLTAVSYLSAIKSSLPFVNFFDGFRTSHELKKIKVLDKSDLLPLVDNEALDKFRKKSLSPFNSVTRGTSQNEDVYFQASEVRNLDYDNLPDIVNNYMIEINKITDKNYKPFNYHGAKDATNIIVAMGSLCDTIKETIADLNNNGYKVGLIEVHLYRPFSKKYFFDVLPKTVKRIAVLDRTKEPGSSGEPLYLDVASMFSQEASAPFIIGGRYGLSSKDTTPSHVKAVYDFLQSDKAFHNFTVGINDDVTNRSIPVNDYGIVNKDVLEFLIYGYGSDGMISCSKDIIKIVGDNTNAYVQGYFQYDSKKSGGLTRSHLRFSSNPIKSSYFVTHPNFVVCSKESYIHKYDMLNNLQNGGTFLYVTDEYFDHVISSLPNNVKKIIALKSIKFYIIDAYGLANKHGLKNKISTILETCIFKISNIMDFNIVTNKINETILTRFSKKGESVVTSNQNVVKESIQYLREVPVDVSWSTLEDNDIKCLSFDNKIFNDMGNLAGNELRVSDLLPYKDGTYLPATSQYEKRGIAEAIPHWIPENCIQCNQCSFVCPHAVVRPFLLNGEEISKAPDTIKRQCLDAVGSNNKFVINISSLDCTGCGVCVRTCPGKNGEKALEMKPFSESCDPDSAYLLSQVSTKREAIKPNVKGSQFAKPAFEYSGACAGCGETPYLKLLTQLFGDRIVISNATGCSSIYGASFPSSSYNVPWANSLFEDNAEYGYGMLTATNTMRHRLKNIIESHISGSDEVTKELLNEWLSNYDDYDITKKVYDNLDYEKAPYLKDLKEYIKTRSIWTIGGDGWAYDIGFSGIDHVLSSDENVNILVLDTQVYSNTGGQSSKASERGSIAKFTSNGKKTAKKDLARISMSYPNVYVASICMGANMQQTISALNEAEHHNGPSIIIAYAPCISQGIKSGMESMIEEEAKAVKCGYTSIFRYNPATNIFNLDFKEPNFDLYESFLAGENRFAMLKAVNGDKADTLIQSLKNDAMKRFNYYRSLSIKEKE
ncbi:MAG: pyruvate:ferredoxin (flavodoxin) oxidoreductase [Bacilli bacterium]|jgi:pyruvate-ferredoxin/flavodoxin oxidoreductase